MNLGIHCWCLSKSLYLMYPGYTLLWLPGVYIAGAYLYHYYTLCTLDTHCNDEPGYTLLVLIYITSIPYVPWIHIAMMTLGIHCWCLSISLLYLMYPGYTLLWWPWVYIAGAYQYHYYTLCTLDTHCYDEPGYTLLVLIYITFILYVPWIHIVMMSLGIHCWCLSISLLYLMYPGYRLFWWRWVYIAGAYQYHYYTLCTLDTNCYDEPGYTLLVLIYITFIPYVPWIHIVMMTLGIYCWCLSISLLYLIYSGYTLLLWPWVYIVCGYLYHYYTLGTLDTHCYDDPGYTLLVLIYITIPYVPWIHIVMMTQGIHCWCLTLSLLYLMYPGYTLLWWPWVYFAGAYLYHYYTLCTQNTHFYDDPRVNIAGAYQYHYYTLCTLDTHCYDDLGYTYFLMYKGIHCWCLSISLYLMYYGYTLLWWPRVLWISIVMMSLDIHCWCLSASLLYLMYPGYTLLRWAWVYIAGAYLYHY